MIFSTPFTSDWQCLRAGLFVHVFHEATHCEHDAFLATRALFNSANQRQELWRVLLVQVTC